MRTLLKGRLASSVLNLWEPIDTKDMNKYARTTVNACLGIFVVFLVEYVPYVALVIVLRELCIIGAKGVKVGRTARKWQKVKDKYSSIYTG